MFRMLKAIWDEFRGDNGLSSPILFIPTLTICIWERSTTHLLSATGASTTWELAWGFVFLLLFLMYRTYNRLDQAFGSREIQWTIERVLEPHNNGHWFFKGKIHNGDTAIEDASVRLLNFQSEDGSTHTVQPVDLQFKGGQMTHKNLYTDGDLLFDIALVSGHPSSNFVFVGSENNVHVEGTAGPGMYSFILKLTGKGFKSRDHKVKIKIKPGGGKDSLEVLEAADVIQPVYTNLIRTSASVAITVILISFIAYKRHKNPPPIALDAVQQEVARKLILRNEIADLESDGNNLLLHLKNDAVAPQNSANDFPETEYEIRAKNWITKTSSYLKNHLEKADYVRFTNEHAANGAIFFPGVPYPRARLFYQIKARIDDLDKMIDANK